MAWIRGMGKDIERITADGSQGLALHNSYLSHHRGPFFSPMADNRRHSAARLERDDHQAGSAFATLRCNIQSLTAGDWRAGPGGEGGEPDYDWGVTCGAYRVRLVPGSTETETS